jgi:S1-C subfamily serine protease
MSLSEIAGSAIYDVERQPQYHVPQYSRVLKCLGGASVVRLALVVISFTGLMLRGAPIPPLFVDSVVALGRYQTRVPGQPPEWVTEASGFLYGFAADAETDPAKHMYGVYLVTNRHVLANHNEIAVRLNPVKATDLVKEVSIDLKDERGNDLWVSHPNPAIDVSVVRLNGRWLREQGVQSSFFGNDKHAADRAKLKEIGIAIGDGVFVLGFPMGLTGTAQRSYVIARQGSIARISDALEGAGNTFLIDAFVFPGNSGGPVVSAGNANAIEGTKAQDRAYLIGVVRSYMPYSDVAISQQTGQVRMLLQENSGLAEVIPIDYVNETIVASRAAESQRPN